MPAISEKIELLGKGQYDKIPGVLTLTSLPTISELEYVSSEDFDKVMVEKILPKAIEEEADFGDLLEIDYTWICRCLRILNYGPYYTTTSIFCGQCDTRSQGEYRVNLETIPCKPLPEGFINEIHIEPESFIEFKGNVIFKLPTIRQIMHAQQDQAFKRSDGSFNQELARICYSIKEIKGKTGLTPVEVKLIIEKEFSPADYILLKDEVRKLSDYGLRAGGRTICPKCGSKEAAFLAIPDDRFFRPTVGDLREWGNSRNKRRSKNV